MIKMGKLVITFALIVTVGAFVAGATEYIVCRIMCPGLGLDVPSFAACAWASFWLLFVGSVISGIQGAIGD